jgi:hypothetical protein
MPTAPRPASSGPTASCPLTLSADAFAAMLNLELADHPVYDGLELQWFDDPDHGTGMLAFLSRRGDGVVDYYVDPALRLDRAGYHIGGGTGAWTETTFEVARLRVVPDGVDAEVRFTDVDGRRVHVRVDDRDGEPRRRGALLAPVSSAIEEPTSLMVVWMPSFDLVRATRRPPLVRIDGEDAATGRLPGQRLHRRHLVKYAAPVVSVLVGRDADVGVGPAGVAPGPDGVAVVEAGGCVARVELTPPWPDVVALAPGDAREGAWRLLVDDGVVTGGRWFVRRADGRAELGVDVTERWRPRGLTGLTRLVTTILPVFRTWPTTYRWRGEAVLDGAPRVEGRWERLASRGGEVYRRMTRSQA